MTKDDSLFGVVKIHRSFDLVVCCHFEGHDLQSDETWRHGEDLGPVGRFVQVLSRLWVGHTRRIAAHDVKVGSGYHASPAVPLNLCVGERSHGIALLQIYRHKTGGWPHKIRRILNV